MRSGYSPAFLLYRFITSWDALVFGHRNHDITQFVWWDNWAIFNEGIDTWEQLDIKIQETGWHER